MLPGLRYVIAGIFVAIIFPMIAFGIAGSFRSANGTSFNPVTAPAAGPALAEYYYSRLYAPSAAGTAALPAEAALAPTVMSDAAKAPEAPAPNEAPKIADQIEESPKTGDAPTIAEAPKPVETPEAGKSLEAGKTDASKTLEISTPLDVPKPANEQVARLPDAKLEPSPPPERAAAPIALPDDVAQGPAGSAVAPESPPPGPPQSVAALAPAESAPPETTGALDRREASPLVGPIPLPPTRPAAKPSHRAAAVAQRSRPRGRAEDAPFIPLKNSLFESLFGGMGKI